MKRMVGVIGGGAAGMMAAITAARNGAQVTILESGDRLGRKILSTGNGKCNLGNLDLSAQKYHGADRRFLEESLERFGIRESLDFFRGIGLLTKEKNGYCYPLSEQASAVLDALRFEVAACGISVRYGFAAEEIRARGSGADQRFQVRGNGQSAEFDRVILACGGKAAPKTGSDGSGYLLAKKLGHSIVRVVPALTSLRCSEEWFRGIAGVRTDAEIFLLGKKGEVLERERGELQLTDYGISGIPVFQLSRTAAYILQDQKTLSAKLDFLPEYSKEALQEEFQRRWEHFQNRTLEEFCTGLLHKKLMHLFLKQVKQKPDTPVLEAGRETIGKMGKLCKDLRVTVLGTGNFQNAQVCAGGVDTREISETMESKLTSGVYFAGEIMDVDGRCGGYNLQWAWTSGYLAGCEAAR